MAATRTGVYVDDFLADFSSFPQELQRVLSLIRELDARAQALAGEIKEEVLLLLHAEQHGPGHPQGDALTPGVGSSSTSTATTVHGGQPFAPGPAQDGFSREALQLQQSTERHGDEAAEGAPPDESSASANPKRKAEGSGDADDAQAEGRVRPRLLQFQNGAGPAERAQEGALEAEEPRGGPRSGRGGREPRDLETRHGSPGAQQSTQSAGRGAAGAEDSNPAGAAQPAGPEDGAPGLPVIAAVPEALAAKQAKAWALGTEKVTLSRQACDLLESHVRRLTQELQMFEQDLGQEQEAKWDMGLA